MKKFPALMLFAMLTLILFGCPKNPDALMSASWVLTDMIQDGEAVEIPETVKIIANFDDGKMNGKGVCNKYFGSYSIEKKSMTIGDVGSTKMGCGEYANLETNYFLLLAKAQSFSLKGDALKIECENGTLKFAKTDPPAEEKK